MSDSAAAGGDRFSWRGVPRRISGIEWVVAGIVVAVLLGLVIAEPAILDAPFQNTRTVVFTVGGSLLAAIALLVMLRVGVRPLLRVAVLLVPFAVVSYWLLAPFFVDDVVDDQFATSIAGAQESPPAVAASPAPAPASGGNAPPATTTTPPGPVLRGSGSFVGLAGHRGTGDAGIFRLPDGSNVVRFENFDIANGPDLRVYLVPGADRRSPTDAAHYFGALRDNVGNQTYDVPARYEVGAGPWTVLVWCEAFDVEFVAATLTLA